MSYNYNWVQLGKGKRGKPIFYRKNRIYTMDWMADQVNLADCLLAAAPFGGPIALTRNPRKATKVSGPDGGKPFVYIYSSSGKLISKFLWNSQKKGSLLQIGWTDEESLAFVTSDAYVFVFDIFGKSLKPFSFPAECEGVLACKIFPSGVAVLSKNLQIWVAEGFDEPKIRKLAKPFGLQPSQDDLNICLEVIPPEKTPTNTCDVILGSKIITVTNITKSDKADSDHGPFKKVVASPSGAAIATFTESGALWVVRSDFQENRVEFNTNSKAPPYQLAWCGEDAVCLYWSPEQLGRDTALLLMIGPNGDYQKFIYDEPIHLITEIDGLRIIKNDTCEYLQRVPGPTLEIFRIGSLEPAAMLFDAYNEFENKNASSIKNIHQIKAQLPKAVQTCLQAACHEYDPKVQRKLLKAAAYGKSFCDQFKHEEFMNTCKKIRVLNAVRDPNVGIPITSKQLERLTVGVLIDRLVQRYQHYLAFRICQYLQLKPENILVHWACSKVKSNEEDEQIKEAIFSKLSQSENASYALVASTAHKIGKTNLAVDLLEKEKNAGEQVPLLLDMLKTTLALEKAIESGETDLVYLVLLHIKKKLDKASLFKLLSQPKFQAAKDLFVSYCSEQDPTFLSNFYTALDLSQENGVMKAAKSFEAADYGERKKLLTAAKESFTKKKDCWVDTKACEDQINLLKTQIELDEGREKRTFVGSSISDTLYKSILLGDGKMAQKLKNDFRVPDKRFWWIKIRALAQTHQWNALEKFSKKKSPIGYRPFVEVCLEYEKDGVNASKYVSRVYDPWEKVELCVRLNNFTDAINTALAEKNMDMLQFIRSKCPNPQTKNTIQQAMQRIAG